LAKKLRSKKSKIVKAKVIKPNVVPSVVLAIDLGGTKVAVAAVSARGKILNATREHVDLTNGVAGLIQQITRLAKPMILKHKIMVGALASAGPLDPIKGELLNPTNLKTDGRYWGRVPIIKALKKSLRISLILENDAAAAALAESWLGKSRRVKNSLVVTLGTGVGVGIICNGQLLRAGRHLHTEAGHILLNINDHERLCGCGNYGCAEAYLSGANVTEWLQKKWQEPSLTGEQLAIRARQKDQRALAVFNKYSEQLGAFLFSLCVQFCPEVVVLSGGFSHASDLFLPATEVRLKELLHSRRLSGHDLLPKIYISKFQDEAGLLGAANIALRYGL